MVLVIRPESPESEESKQLIGELEAYLDPMYPKDSQYGLSAAELARQDVAFFVAKMDQEVVGCGGVKLAGDYAEIKRMYVRLLYRGNGVGTQILQHLEDYAREHGQQLMRLETGIYQNSAIKLYEKSGYKSIDAFPPYRPGKFNLFFEKRL